MSTRTNIVVKLGNTKIYIYRHHDGYPAETGGDLVSRVLDDVNGTDFVAGLLSEKREGHLDGSTLPVYELTSDLHGDIEWLYVFDFPTFRESGDKLKISVVERKQSSEEAWPMIKESEAKVDIGLKGLIDLVNLDRAKMNAYSAKYALKALIDGNNQAYALNRDFYDLVTFKEKEKEEV